MTLDFRLQATTKKPVLRTKSFATIAQIQNAFGMESNQLFSGAAGSTIPYNVYVENTGRSIATYSLAVSSNRGYYVEVWRDTDQIGSGETRLIPPQGSTIVLNPGEVATLIAKVTIPSDANSGTVDTTTLGVVDTLSSASDSVTLTTSVNAFLPYPSDWIQLGSDPTFPTPPPERIDVKAIHCTNNGTFLFFRIAEVSRPNPNGFFYCAYLDTKAGGQQIENYNYDYMLSSDGALYEWNGANWSTSGFQTYWQIDGTSMVLWTNLSSLGFDMQEIHILSRSTTKDYTWKDELGPFTILRNSISEIPLILIPIMSFAIYLTISKSIKKKSKFSKQMAISSNLR